MADVALALPLDQERALDGTALRHGHRIVAHCSGAAELATRIATLRPDLAVVSADEQYLSRQLIAQCDAAGVRMVVIVATEAERRRAASLGIADAATPTDDWGELLTVAVPALEPPVRAPERRGTLVTVWGPHGAPGRTSLAISIAAEAAQLGLGTLLIDADTHAASVAPALGLLDESPGFAAACRLAATDSLDAAELERVAQVHRARPGSFRVLTGLGRPSRWPELTVERIEATLAAARDWAELTIVDVAAGVEEDDELGSDLVPARRNAATATALRAADHLVLVGAADPVGLSRLVRAHAELLDSVAPARVSVVVNKLRATSVGLNPAGQVRQTLRRFAGIDEPVLVPLDVAAFDGALLSGRTLPEVASRSAARTAIRRLVGEHLLADRVPGPGGSGARERTRNAG
ncbi:MAG: regulator [Microbacteriaceae bacterium]